MKIELAANTIEPIVLLLLAGTFITLLLLAVLIGGDKLKRRGRKLYSRKPGSVEEAEKELLK